MKIQKLPLNHKILLVLGVLLVGATASTLLALRPDSSANASDYKPSVAEAPSSAFSFNASEAAGWRKGPANETSTVLFKNDSDCFISTDLRAGAVDETEELQKIAADLSAAGYTRAASGTVVAAFDRGATENPVTYTLHQYTVSGTSSSEKLYKTQVFGYVPLGKKHIRVQAHCNDDTPLLQIHDAISAITLGAKY